jgi:pimeloyl-ACP methyl ester carboxylesterase
MRRRTRRGATIEDVLLDRGGEAVEAFVVAPARAKPRAGVLFLHWLGEHRSDRTQFLDEAVDLAAHGVRSVLPAGRLPWLVPPTDATADVEKIETEVRREVAALEALAAGLPAKAPIALVGHDFGAMSGSVLLSRSAQFAAAILIAANPRWADWFLPFWKIEGDRFDYARALAPLDPIEVIATVDRPLLFQFSQRDHYIAPMSAVRFARAAKREASLEWYVADHAMRSRKARAARLEFLRRELALA